MLPSLLLQKIPAPNFIAEVRLEIPEGTRNLRTGLILFGEDYAWIGVQPDPESGEMQLGYASCRDARIGCNESFEVEKQLTSSTLTVRMTLVDGGGTVFSYWDDTGRLKTIGELFQARPGRWVGARIGLFAVSEETDDQDYVEVDSIRFFKPR